MKVIGILGGVASGKSAVAGFFRELGAGVLDADRAGHEVLEIAEVKRAIGRVHEVVGAVETLALVAIRKNGKAPILFEPSHAAVSVLAYREAAVWIRREAVRAWLEVDLDIGAIIAAFFSKHAGNVGKFSAVE